MRVIEAGAGGLVTTVAVVLIASRIGIDVDLVVAGAVAFLAGFLATMLRADRQYVVRDRK